MKEGNPESYALVNTTDSTSVFYSSPSSLLKEGKTPLTRVHCTWKIEKLLMKDKIVRVSS